MTPEQQAAVALVRETLAEMPQETSLEMARQWIAHLRGVLRQVADAFPEEAVPGPTAPDAAAHTGRCASGSSDAPEGGQS